MSAPEDTIAPAGGAPRRANNGFRRHSKASLPTKEQARRQSDVVQSTWRHFGAPGPAIAFLNSRHAALAAQPLHLAIESDEGLGRVQELLAEMALRASPPTRF